MNEPVPTSQPASAWPALALALPGCIMASAMAAALIMAMFNRHPMWRYEQWNLSEAAAVRDRAEVMRLIEFAEDPNLPRDVRAGLLFDYPVRVTPLEAAVVAGDDTMLRRLIDSGALVDAAVWNRLNCLADGDDVRRVLNEHRPGSADPECRRRVSIEPAQE